MNNKLNLLLQFIIFFAIGVVTYYTFKGNIIRIIIFLFLFEILYYIMYNKFWSFIPRVVLNIGYLSGFFIFYGLKL